MKDTPKYKSLPRRDKRLLAVIGGILAFITIIGLLFLPISTTGALFLFGITLLLAFFFWITVPRYYLIYPNRMVINLGGPFAFGVALQSIRTVKAAKPCDTISYAGLKFATAFSGGVEIIRRKGPNLIITPEQPDAFIGELNEALQLCSQETTGCYS